MKIQKFPSRSRFCAILAALAFSLNLQALDLNRDLSAEQKQNAGLHKLSALELSVLQALLDNAPAPATQSVRAVEVAPISAVPASSERWAPTPVSEKEAPQKFSAEVTVEFAGSAKGTRIALSNGQVWEQTDSTSVSAALKDRRIQVMPGFLGSWKMRFMQSNLFIRVKRVR